jgi:hypothetical protein
MPAVYRRLVLILILLSLTSLRALCQETVAQRADALTVSLVKADATGIASVTTGDFKYSDIFGRGGTAPFWIERFKNLLAMAKDGAAAPLPAVVTTRGDTAITMVKVKITGVGKDRLGDEGPLDMTVTHRTDWVKDGAVWKLKSAREVYFQGTANRRPLSFSRSMAEEDTRKGLQGMYGAISEIYEKRDWEKIEKGIGEDFAFFDMVGVKLTKTELLDRVKAGTKVVSNPIVTIDPQQVAFDGDNLYVIRVMRLIGDAQLPDGKMGRVSYLNIARDTFVKKDKDWKPSASHELHAEASVNGVPIPLSLISGK